MKRLLLLAYTTLFLSSCFKDKYDFNNLDSSGYNPSIAAPIVNTNLVLGDLMKSMDTTFVKTDQNKLLHITYASKLFSYKVADLVKIPTQTISQNLTLGAFSIANINSTTDITLGSVVSNMAEPEKSNIKAADGGIAPFPAIPAQGGGTFAIPTLSGFNSVTFNAGTLTMSITNNWPILLNNVQIQIKNVADASLIGTFNFPVIAAGGSATDNVSLPGITMQNNISVTIVSFSSPGSFPAAVPIDLTDDLKISISSSGIGIQTATAVFPSQEVLNKTIDTYLAMTNGEEFNTMLLKSGKISYNITYGIRENAKIELTLPYVKKAGVAFSKIIDISSDHINSTVVSGTFDLAGYTFDLTGGGGKSNYLPTQLKASVVSSGVAVPINNTDAVTANITINNMAFSYIEGYVGKLAIDVPADSINFAFFKNNLGATIKLADPQLALKIKNSVGIPMNADLSKLSVVAENGTRIPFTGIANPLTINNPTSNGLTATTNIDINKNTTNIVDVLSSNPKRIIFGMKGVTNPNGKTSNYITDSSAISVSMNMDVPLYGSINNLVIKDTLDFPVEAFNNVLTATMRTNITSEYPIEAAVQMYFLDARYAVIDKLFDDGAQVVVPASVIDANGEKVKSSFKQTDMPLSEAKVEKLKSAKYILLESKLATSNSGATAAKFYATYKMNIKLGVLAKVKLQLKKK